MRSKIRSRSSDTQIVARRNFRCGSNSRCLPTRSSRKSDFDGLVGAGAHRNLVPTNYRDGSDISVGRGIHDDPMNTAIREWLAPQIEHG